MSSMPLPALDPRDLELRHHRVKSARIPLVPGMADRIITGNLDATEPMLAAREWLKAATGVLLMLGTRGTGKTVAAAWIVSRHPYARYVKAREFVRLSMAAFGDDHLRYAELLEAPLLVIDDLGTERDRERGKEALHDVVDDRLALPTIVISNMDKEAFKARYDARTIDRLREVGTAVEFAGPSLRPGQL